MDYYEMRREIVRFINTSGISAYDICRITKELCACRTCRYYVQHFAQDGQPVDFGHCRKNNTIKSVKPNTNSCGAWSLNEERDQNE